MRRDGQVIHRISITGYQDYVGIVADYLTFLAADLPGVVVPPGR